MSDMSASEAFTHVVDRLVDEVRRNEGSADKLIKTAGDLDEARLELAKTKKALADYGAGADAYVELYKIVEVAAKKLQATNRPDSMETATALMVRLAAARKFIDPIPF